MSENQSNSDGSQPGPSRKRQRSVESWKKTQRKIKRNSGQCYIATTGRVIEGKKIGPPCSCPLKCYDSVGQSEIENIFNNYWKMADHHSQTAYLSDRVTSREVKRSRVKGRPSRVSRTLKYTVLKENKEIEVCRTAFVNIHNITVKRIRNAVDKMMTGAGSFDKDQRGKHVPGTKIEENKLNLARKHILSLRTVSSRHTGANSSKSRHLRPGLNCKILYDMYRQWMASENESSENIIKEWKYREIFHESNIGSEPTQRDSYNFCDDMFIKVRN